MIKVWSIVFVQLAITAAVSCYAMIDKSFVQFMEQNLAIMILCFVAVIVIQNTVFCCSVPARKVPLNYILLLGFTLAFAYCVAFITTRYEPFYVFQAAFLLVSWCSR